MTALPAPTPPVNDETAPFWAGLGDGRLLLPVCDACGHHIWYPRGWCPVCGNDEVTWTEHSGRGTVYARTILHRSMGPWAEAAPFVIAYVELDEGPRVLTNVVVEEPTDVAVGAAVEAVFVPVAEPVDGTPATHLLRFALRR
ncbi:MAG: Zn-ribbon domain-containing OB-fold protein [Acidimicrobiales bacterium]